MIYLTSAQKIPTFFIGEFMEKPVVIHNSELNFSVVKIETERMVLIMKKTKIISIALACLLVGSFLPGHAIDSNANAAIPPMDTEVKELQETTFGTQDFAAEAVAKGANDFAFRLSAALARETGDENFVCSPYSVWIPLAALVNATDTANRELLLSALSASGISVNDINNAASRMLYDLTKQRDKKYAEEYGAEYYHFPLKTANAIFVGTNVTLKQSFAQTFMDYYRGTAMTVDFSSNQAAEAVNQWARDNTDGLIPSIIDQFDPNTVAAIANAIYFSDRWEWEFSPDKTTEDIFHSPVGDTTAFFMLREGDKQRYYEDDHVQAMPLRFQTGGGMYIILPKDSDATGLLSAMTSEYFDEILSGSTNSTGKLLLPRFSIDSGVIRLKDTLAALGVPLFDESAAPLTGGLLEEDLPVWLSDAVHSSVIEIDEKGVTAAAVTVISADGAGRPQPTEPFEMNCNKPFVFVLYGHTHDGGSQVLFTGIVNQIHSGNENAENPSSWALEQVQRAMELDLVPDALDHAYTQRITRAEFCALAVKLYEAVAGEEISQRRAFADTDDTNVQKMGALDVVSGVGNGRFDPNGTLTREQAAVILSRLADAIGKPLPKHVTTFSDQSTISPWALAQVGHVQAAEIMHGTGDNNFDPQNSYTREQSIVTILRLYDMVK